MTENWLTWYFGGVDSGSRLRFLKFQPQNLFLGKFKPKKSKLSVFPENWYAWHLEDADFYSNFSFLKIGTQSVSTMLILIPTLFFSVSNPKSFFGQIWAENSELFILTEDWHTWYIEDADSYSSNSFLNCQP